MASQWENLLQNLGVWDGSFTRLSPTGEVIEDMPTCVSLEGLDNNRRIRQTIARFRDSSEPTPQVLEYSTLNRNILLFEDGAFSIGSGQFSPFADFGAEFGFVNGDRRLRVVVLFDRESRLSGLTLIREFRRGSEAAEFPPLSSDRLLGTWQGEATTLYPDWRPRETEATTLSISQDGDRLYQSLQTSAIAFHSEARIAGDRLVFEDGERQILLLPDGVSCHTPLRLSPRQAFFLEVGWLRDRLRQRLLRFYDEKGTWSRLTLVTERLV